MSAFDHDEDGVVTVDALVKATSKEEADEIVLNRLVENFPFGVYRYTHRVYTVSLINDLLDKMNINKYQAAYMITGNCRVVKTPIDDKKENDK